jgi:hypothetical protein
MLPEESLGLDEKLKSITVDLSVIFKLILRRPLEPGHSKDALRVKWEKSFSFGEESHGCVEELPILKEAKSQQ